MSRRRSSYVIPSTNNRICCFCGLSEDNELEFGKFYEHDGIITHYYCLLLSSNTEQKGTDNEGILGFLTADIQKELRRGKRLICSYCKRTGATLGCCNVKCKRIFHFPCGLRAGSLHQFFGEFRSYCISHRPIQKVEGHTKEKFDALDGALCYICYDAVNPDDAIDTLWAPCCRKNALFHRKCVQQLATSAGYFFKCPLCNNKKQFREAMLEYGIFIPSQDASWELEPNAFQELLHRHNRCDAKTCTCPKGRLHISSNAKWELVLCRLCGSQGIHMACGQLKWINPVWECPECIAILSKSTETAAPNESKKTKISPYRTSNDVHNESDYENSDTDISVGNRSPPPNESNSRSSSLSPLCVHLRPGPRSFKLQQVEKVVMGLKTYKKDNTNSEETNLSAIANSSKEDNNVSNSFVEEGCSKMTKNSFVSYPVQSTENLIIIDSDDDIEIVSEKPKHNILTTNDGTKIEIHNLHEAVSPCHVEGDVKVTKSTSPIPPPVPLMQPAMQNFRQSSLVINNENEMFNPNTSNSNITIQNLPVYSQSERTPRSVLRRNNDSGDDSIMNIKITNVTSLPPEVFASVPEDLNISQNTRPIELNAKRKSNVNHNIIDKNAVDSTNVRVIEKSKRLRTNDPGPSSLTSESINYNINVSQAGQSVPFIVTELPQTVPTNTDNRTKNPANIEGNITSVKPVLTENPQDNLILQYLTSASNSASYQNSHNLNTTSDMQNAKIHHTEMQQISNGVITNRYSMPNSSNISDYYTALSQQNGGRVYVRVSHNNMVDQSRIVTPQAHVPTNSTNNLTNQNKSEKNDSIYTSNQDISNNESMSRNNNHCIPVSQSGLTNMFVGTITNNYVAISSNYKGSPNDKNKMSEVASTISQQNNSNRFTSGCDGDAGTDPAIESRHDDSTSAVCRVAQTSEAATLHRTNGASNRKERRSCLNKMSTINWAVSNARCSSGFSPARGSCDRPRMIPESMCLRDLKFRVCGFDTIQVYYD